MRFLSVTGLGMFLLFACGGPETPKLPPGKFPPPHADDWSERIETTPSSTKTVEVDGRRFQIRQYKPATDNFRVGDHEYGEFTDRYRPSFFDVADAGGKVLVPVRPRQAWGIPRYGIFVQEYEGTTVLRLDTKSGKLATSDVVEVGGADPTLRAYVVRSVSKTQAVLDVVSPKGTHQFDVDHTRAHPWEEASDGFAVIRAIDGNHKDIDVLVDADTKPVAAPATGLVVIPARRFIQDNLYDTYKDNPAYFGSFVAVRAPGTAQDEALWWILDKNGRFGAPRGARGFLEIPFSLDGKPTRRDRPLPYWFVRYDVEGERVKKWGTATGMLDSVSAPRWYDVRRVTTDYAMRGGEMICAEDEKGWDCFPTAETLKPDLAEPEPRPSLHGATIQDAFVREAAAQIEAEKQSAQREEAERRYAIWRQGQEAFAAAWAGKPSSGKAVDAAWEKAVASNDRAAIERIVWLKNDAVAWNTYLDGVDVATLPTATLRAAVRFASGPRRDAMVAKLDKERREEEARVKRQREQEAQYLRERERFKPYPVDVPAGSVYVAPSNKPVGANAGPSEEQRMRDYSHELDSKIYGNGNWKR